jgi:hypothetical protein
VVILPTSRVSGVTVKASVWAGVCIWTVRPVALKSITDPRAS